MTWKFSLIRITILVISAFLFVLTLGACAPVFADNLNITGGVPGPSASRARASMTQMAISSRARVSFQTADSIPMPVPPFPRRNHPACCFWVLGSSL
jgi:hypothetical protein